jgi:hypothetical protein
MNVGWGFIVRNSIANRRPNPSSTNWEFVLTCMFQFRSKDSDHYVVHSMITLCVYQNWWQMKFDHIQTFASCRLISKIRFIAGLWMCRTNKLACSIKNEMKNWNTQWCEMRWTWSMKWSWFEVPVNVKQINFLLISDNVRSNNIRERQMTWEWSVEGDEATKLGCFFIVS